MHTVVVAGFFRRALAAILDVVVVLPWLALVTVAILWVLKLQRPKVQWDTIDVWWDLLVGGNPAVVTVVGIWLLGWLAYGIIFQCLFSQTVGMRWMNIRIINVYGEDLGWARTVLRTLGYYAVGLATLGLGFLWIGFDREKRGAHDWLAGTYVVLAGITAGRHAGDQPQR